MNRYDPYGVSRNVWMLARTVGNTVDRQNRNRLDMANLGLADANQSARHSLQKGDQSLKLAKFKQDKFLDTPMTMESVVNSDMVPEHMRKGLGDQIRKTIDPNTGKSLAETITNPRQFQGYMQKILGAIREDKYRDHITPYQQAYMDYLGNLGKRQKQSDLSLKKEKEFNRRAEKWANEKLLMDARAAGFTIDKDGNAFIYGELDPVTQEYKKIPANAEYAQKARTLQTLYGMAIEKARIEGKNPERAYNEIMAAYAEDRRKKQAMERDAKSLALAAKHSEPNTVPQPTPVATQAPPLSRPTDMWQNYMQNRNNAFQGAGIPPVLMQDVPQRNMTWQGMPGPYNARR